MYMYRYTHFGIKGKRCWKRHNARVELKYVTAKAYNLSISNV